MQELRQPCLHRWRRWTRCRCREPRWPRRGTCTCMVSVMVPTSGSCALETVLALDLNLASDIGKEPVKDADPAEILGQAGVLCFALLEEVVLVEDGGKRGLFVYQALDCRSIVKTESAGKLSGGVFRAQGDYLQNMAVDAQSVILSCSIYGSLSRYSTLCYCLRTAPVSIRIKKTYARPLTRI